MAPGQLPSIYSDIQNKLNAMDKDKLGFTVNQDPDFSDRVNVSNGRGQKLSLNLTNVESDAGRVWLVGSDSGGQQKVVTPRLTANYNATVGLGNTNKKAEIDYTAQDSSSVLGATIYQAFRKAGKTKGEVSTFFHGLMSNGDTELGMTPAPSVPAGWKATQDTSIGQIAFNITSDGKAANADETHAVKQDFIRQFGDANVPGLQNTISPIYQDRGIGGKDIDFKFLNSQGYLPNKQGNSLTASFISVPETIQTTGEWMLNEDPKRKIKSTSLAKASDPVMPYRDDGLNIFPVRAQATTNTNKPGFAISNVLMPGETQGRSLERGTFVFSATPVAGGAIAYKDPNEVKADLYGREAKRKAILANLNLNDLLSGKQKIEFNDYQSRGHGGGQSISHIGTMTNGDVSESIKMRNGPGVFRTTGGHALSLPKYVDPVSGKFSQTSGEGFVKTEMYHEQIQGAMPGVPLSYGRQKNAVLSIPGVNESATSIKGGDVKAVEVPVGFEQQFGDTGLNVTHMTSELKGTSFLHNLFGGMNYNQLQGIAQDWQANDPNGAGGKLAQYLEKNHGEAAIRGRELGVNFNAAAQAIGYQGGGAGLGMMVDIFNKTIRSADPDSEANARNIQMYGTGKARGGERMGLGIVTQDAIDEMKLGLKRSMKGSTPEQVDAAFDKNFSFTPHGEGTFVGQKILQKGDYVASMLYNRRSENVHGNRVGADWLEAITKQFPEAAKRIGGSIETFVPQGATQAAQAGILKYAITQREQQQYVKSRGEEEEPQQPTNRIEIDDAKLSAISAHLQSMPRDTSPVQRMKSVNKTFFAKDEGVASDALLYNKTLDTYLPNPKAVLGSTFSELGTEAPGIAKPASKLFETLGNIVNDDEYTAEQKRLMANVESERTLSYAEKLITGSGNFAKSLFGTNIDSLIAGRNTGGLNLKAHEKRVGFERVLQMAKQAGYHGRDAMKQARSLIKSGFDMVGQRLPNISGKVYAWHQPSEAEMKGRYLNEDARDEVNSNPKYRGLTSESALAGRLNKGDYDGDPLADAALVEKDDKGNLVPINDPNIKANYVTAEQVNEQESSEFTNEGMKVAVDANAKQMEDFVSGKNVVEKALDQKKAYSPKNAIQDAFDAASNSGIGMGTTFNVRRKVLGSLSIFGNSAKQRSGVETSLPAIYQPALDKLLKGRQATGTQVSSMIARPYFHKGYQKKDPKTGKLLPLENQLRLYSTETVNRENTRIPTYDPQTGAETGSRILPGETTHSTDVDVAKIMTVGEQNKMAMFQAKAFTEGYTMKGVKGGVNMSREQFASWFSAPGANEEEGNAEYENLLGRLNSNDDRSNWAQSVLRYQDDLRSRVMNKTGSTQKSMEAPLTAPVNMAILAGAVSKQVSGINNETGQEQHEGTSEVAQTLLAQLTPGLQDKIKAAAGISDIDHRMKDKNLRLLQPRNLRRIAENVGNDVKGMALKSLARMMDVKFNPFAKAEGALGANKSKLLPRGTGKPVSIKDEIEANNVANKFDWNKIREIPFGNSVAPSSSQNEEDRLAQSALEARASGATPTSAQLAWDAKPDSALIDEQGRTFSANTGKEVFDAGGTMDASKREVVADASRKKDEVSGKTFDAEKGSYGDGATPPSGRGGGKNGGGGGTITAAPNEYNDPSGRPLPRHVQEQIEAANKGYSLSVAQKVRGIVAKANQYQKGEQKLAPYLHDFFTNAGFTGELTAGSIRRRAKEYYAADKNKMLSTMDPAMLEKSQQMSEMFEETNLAHVMIKKVSLGGDREEMQNELDEATNDMNGLGLDMASGAMLKTMIGKNFPKNPYAMQGAQELAGSAGFKSLHAQLLPIMGGRGRLGVNAMKQIRNVLADNPNSVDILREAGSYSTEKAGNIPAEVMAVGKFAGALQKKDPDLLKSGNSITSLAQKEVDGITQSYERQAKAAKALQEVQEKGLQGTKKETEARHELAKATAARQEQVYNVLGRQAQADVERLQSKLKIGGNTLSEKESAQLEKTLGRVDRYSERETKARNESVALLEQEQVGKLGGAARKMLGGFGLMYAKSIYSIATEGLGYGYDERVKYDQSGAAAAYGSMGGVSNPLNQQLSLNTNKALYGANNDPRMATAAWMARNPGARDAVGAGLAGISTWGYSQFAAKELGSPGLAAASPYIGMIAATGSLLANANSKSQDPTSLAYRTTTGRGGPTDYLALAEMAGGTVLNKVYGGKVFGESPKNLSSYFANKKMQVDFQQQLAQGATTDQLLSGDLPSNWAGPTNAEADARIGKAERFAALQNEVASRFKNYSTESQSRATSFLARSGMSVNDDRLKNVITDYELGGGQAEKSAFGALSALGYNSAQMYKKGSGQEMNLLSSLQVNLANQQDEGQKAIYSQGVQALSQLKGAQYIEGVGSRSKSEVTDEKINKLIEGLGKIVGTGAGEVFTSQQNASDAARRAGMNYQAPNISSFLNSDGTARQMTAAEVTKETSLAGVVEQSANSRIQNAASFSSYATNLGRDQLASSSFDFLMGGNRGDQWKRTRMLNGDPLMLANAAASGVDINQLQGPVNVQGRQFSASLLANTDISNEGRVTGLGWGRTGLQRGSISNVEMGSNLFGGMNNIGTQAAIGGVQLRNAVTLMDGTKVSSVGGTMGLQMQQNYLEDDYQQSMMGFQGRAQARDYTFQMASWAIQDKQRNLSNRQQMSSFGFQEEGMGLQQQGIDMQNRNFWANAGLQQQQMTMTRGFTRQDWAIDDNTRAMQWGWKTEDFQENQRFMTGRDRRLAERNMERDTTMHGVQEDKVTRDKSRQQELWNLEDTRFDLQKSQHTESIAMQEKQLDLQHRQFEENKKFYAEGKKLEDEMIKLQRAHWLEEHNASVAQLAISQQHQKDMMSLKQASDQLSIAAELNNATLNTLVDDSMTKFQESIIALAEKMGLFTDEATSLPATGLVTASGNNPYSNHDNNPYAPNSYSTNTQVASGTVATQTQQAGHFGKAGGGSLASSMTNVMKTGEAGWEYVVNGMVVPHEQSVQMEQAGIFNGASTITPSFTSRKSELDSIAPQVFSSSGGQSMPKASEPKVIVINIGNQELKRFVVNSFGEEF